MVTYYSAFFIIIQLPLNNNIIDLDCIRSTSTPRQPSNQLHCDFNLLLAQQEIKILSFLYNPYKRVT